MSNLFGVPAEWLTNYWDMAEPYIERVCKRSKGRFTPETVLVLLNEGKWQLWLIVDRAETVGAICTTVHTYPTGLRACYIHFIAGSDAKEHIGILDELTIWAKEQGCRLLEGLGREGWARHIKGIGLEGATRLNKEI